jgi:NitT/TauT family transport system substrate-binding protein
MSGPAIFAASVIRPEWRRHRENKERNMQYRPISRRTALAGVLVAAALPSRLLAQSLEKVRVSIIPVYDVAPLYAAIVKGYFRDVGLEVDTAPTAGGAAGIPGLIGGSVDIAYGNVVSALLAVQQGLDLKVIAAGTKNTGFATDKTQMMVAADSGIKSAKDLEGKSLAVNTRNNVIWLYARAWIKKSGANPDLVTFREVPFPQMEDAVRQHRVDAAFMIPPFSITAAAKPGLLGIGQPYSEVQIGADIGQYLTTGKTLAQKPETIRKFTAGLRKGVEWFNENKLGDEALGIVSGYTKMDVSLLKRVGDMGTAPLRSEIAQIQQTMDLMIDSKLLNQPIDLSAVVASTAL